MENIMRQVTYVGEGAVSPADPRSRAIGDAVAMQLSAMAYCSLTNDFTSTLGSRLTEWKVVWEPKKAVNGNWSCIVYNNVQYVLVLRGRPLNFSKASFDNWLEDELDVLDQMEWPFATNSTQNLRVSKGCWNALQDILSLENAAGEGILGFLKKNAFEKDKFLCVTGHGLGGSLATVTAHRIHYELLSEGYRIPDVFSVLTFGAPTVWNKPFADDFDRIFPKSWRYINPLDIIPYMAHQVERLTDFYTFPAPEADRIPIIENIACLGDIFDAVADLIEKCQEDENSCYAPVNTERGTVILNREGQIFPVKALREMDQWFEQAQHQHDHRHYLQWLGASPVV